MDCPTCAAKSETLDTRTSPGVVRRRRRCKKCGIIFKTEERAVKKVVKIKQEKTKVDEPFCDDSWDHVPSGGYDKWE